MSTVGEQLFAWHHELPEGELPMPTQAEIGDATGRINDRREAERDGTTPIRTAEEEVIEELQVAKDNEIIDRALEEKIEKESSLAKEKRGVVKFLDFLSEAAPWYFGVHEVNPGDIRAGQREWLQGKALYDVFRWQNKGEGNQVVYRNIVVDKFGRLMLVNQHASFTRDWRTGLKTETLNELGLFMNEITAETAAEIICTESGDDIDEVHQVRKALKDTVEMMGNLVAEKVTTKTEFRHLAVQVYAGELGVRIARAEEQRLERERAEREEKKAKAA